MQRSHRLRPRPLSVVPVSVADPAPGAGLVLVLVLDLVLQDCQINMKSVSAVDVIRTFNSWLFDRLKSDLSEYSPASTHLSSGQTSGVLVQQVDQTGVISCMQVKG